MSNQNRVAIIALLLCLPSLYAQTAHPGAAEQTFPSTPVGKASAPVTISFTFDSAGTLSSTPYVLLTQGALNLDFKAAITQPSNACIAGHSYRAGDQCSLNVIFTPTKPQKRLGAAQLMGSAAKPIATFHLVGTGEAPQISFQSSPTPAAYVGSGFLGAFGLAVDGSGNVFVMDYGAVKEIVAVNGKVSGASEVIPVISNGGIGFGGLALDASGNVFVGNVDVPGNVNTSVYEIVAVNGVVSASSAFIALPGNYSAPQSVAVDASGNVFVADHGNNAVYEIEAVNGTVSAISAVVTAASGFSNLHGVAIDHNGNLFVGDGDTVKEIEAMNGRVSPSSPVITVGSGFVQIYDVAVDGGGNVFVADTGGLVLKEILANDGAVSLTSAVITLATNRGFRSLALDGNGNVFAANAFGVQEFDLSDPPSLTVLHPNPAPAKSVNIQNIGSASLTETALTISGNFSQVADSGKTPDCSATITIAPGGSCNLTLEPTAAGPLSGSVTLTNNNLNVSRSQQTMLLSEPPTLAAYSGLDTTTQGSWISIYGNDGHLIANDPADNAPPSYATVTFTGDKTYTWAVNTNDPRAMEISGSFGNIASTFYSATSFTINVDLTDGNKHRLALYLLDWESKTRSETISIFDAATNAVLDTRTFSGFHNGHYAIWNIQGNVIIKVSRTGTANAVVAGLFFDTVPAAAAQIGFESAERDH